MALRLSAHAAAVVTSPSWQLNSIAGPSRLAAQCACLSSSARTQIGDASSEQRGASPVSRRPFQRTSALEVEEERRGGESTGYGSVRNIQSRGKQKLGVDTGTGYELVRRIQSREKQKLGVDTGQMTLSATIQTRTRPGNHRKLHREPTSISNPPNSFTLAGQKEGHRLTSKKKPHSNVDDDPVNDSLGFASRPKLNFLIKKPRFSPSRTRTRYPSLPPLRSLEQMPVENWRSLGKAATEIDKLTTSVAVMEDGSHPNSISHSSHQVSKRTPNEILKRLNREKWISLPAVHALYRYAERCGDLEVRQKAKQTLSDARPQYIHSESTFLPRREFVKWVDLFRRLGSPEIMRPNGLRPKRMLDPDKETRLSSGHRVDRWARLSWPPRMIVRPKDPIPDVLGYIHYRLIMAQYDAESKRAYPMSQAIDMVQRRLRSGGRQDSEAESSLRAVLHLYMRYAFPRWYDDPQRELAVLFGIIDQFKAICPEIPLNKQTLHTIVVRILDEDPDDPVTIAWEDRKTAKAIIGKLRLSLETDGSGRLLLPPAPHPRTRQRSGPYLVEVLDFFQSQYGVEPGMRTCLSLFRYSRVYTEYLPTLGKRSFHQWHKAYWIRKNDPQGEGNSIEAPRWKHLGQSLSAMRPCLVAAEKIGWVYKDTGSNDPTRRYKWIDEDTDLKRASEELYRNPDRREEIIAKWDVLSSRRKKKSPAVVVSDVEGDGEEIPVQQITKEDVAS